MSSIKKSNNTDTTALLVEFIFGFSGMLGMGWLYAGNIGIGIAAFLGFLTLNGIELVGLLTMSENGIGIAACLVFLFNLVIVGLSAFAVRSHVIDSGARGHPRFVVYALVVPFVLVCCLGVAMTAMAPTFESMFTEILHEMGTPIP